MKSESEVILVVAENRDNCFEFENKTKWEVKFEK